MRASLRPASAAARRRGHRTTSAPRRRWLPPAWQGERLARLWQGLIQVGGMEACRQEVTGCLGCGKAVTGGDWRKARRAGGR